MTLWKRNLAVAWVTQVFSLSGFGFVLPFLPYYVQEIAPLTDSELRFWVGVIASAPAVTMAIMAPIWGEIADRYGHKLMLLRAMAAGAVVMFLMSRARSIPAILVLRALQGVFTGTVGAAFALVAAGTPARRISSAMGFLSSSNFVGVSVGPVIGGLAAQQFGYRVSFAIGAVVLAVGFVLVTLFIVEPDREHGCADEEDASSGAGQSASGSCGAAERTGARPPTVRVPGLSWLARVKTVIGPEVRALFVLLFLLRLVRTLPIPFLPLLVQTMRGTIEGAPVIMGVLQAGAGLATAFAALTLTRLGDRFNRLGLLSILLGVGCLFALPLFAMRSLAAFAVLYITMTFFVGGAEPMVQSELAFRTPQRTRGLSFGVQTTVGNVGWAIAPLIGSFVSIRFGLAAVFLANALVLCVTEAVGVRTLLRTTQSGRRMV